MSDDLAPTSPFAGPEHEASQAPSIPGYQLLSLVHRGGQGAVHRAVQLATRRIVAVKLLPAGAHAAPQERRRFEREVDILATLDHPNVVSLLDGGVAEGQPFLVMRFVEGEDLDAWTKRMRPDPRAVARVVVATCRAVEHAHARGVLHRDIKPSNVRIDGEGVPHVLDFGLAAPLRLDGAAEPSSLTMDGVFLGTLAYAAPEQLRGEASRVDVRTDVHGLGVLLFWMLTGELPHAASGDLAEALSRLSREEPRAPRSLQPALDRDIETVTLKAVARDPERRYQTVQALREDLERWLAGDAIAARRDSRAYVLRKACRRHAAILIVAAAAFVLLAVALVAVVRQRDAARIEAATSRRLADVLTETLTLPPGTGLTRGRENVSVGEAITLNGGRLVESLRDDPAVQARVAGALGSALIPLKRWQDAEEMLELATAWFRQHDAFPEERLRAVVALAKVRGGQGRYEENEWLCREALSVARAHRGKLPPRALPASLANLANAVARAHCTDERAALMREALRTAFEDCLSDRVLIAKLRVRMPDLPNETIDETAARRLARIAMARSAVPPEDPMIAEALSALGVQCTFGDRPDLAMLPLIEALQHRERHVEAPDPHRAEARANLGHCLAAVGDAAEARRLFQSALAEFEASGTGDSHAADVTREGLAALEAAPAGT